MAGLVSAAQAELPVAGLVSAALAEPPVAGLVSAASAEPPVAGRAACGWLKAIEIFKIVGNGSK